MRKLFSVLAILALTAFLGADDTDEQSSKKVQSVINHEISVTANKIETPARETASSVTIISREELEQSRSASVLAAIKDVLGLSITQNGPSGGASSVMIRGANSEHTLILLDGMELNDPISPSRSSDLAHLTIESIERIEILRGPQSLLYGSDALGGVINIITRRGTGKPRLQLSTMAGSLGTAEGTVQAGGGGKSFHFSLGTTYHRSSGFSAAGKDYAGNSENDGYRNLSLTGNMGYLPAHNLELDLTFRYLNSRAEIDNFGGPYGDDPNNIQNARSLMIKGQARASFLNRRWEQILSLSLVSSHRDMNNPSDSIHPFDSEAGQYDSRLLKLDWQHNLYLHDTNTLMLGLEYQKEQGESEYISESLWGPFSSLFPQKSAGTVGFFIQDQVRLSGRFSATAGVRMDHFKSFGAVLTYRIAPALFFPETDTKIKASYGTGFKAPSLYQMYAPGTFWGPIGNTALLPEKSKGWDAGMEQLFFNGRVHLGFTFFHNDFENLILFDYSTGYTNIGLSSAAGIETNLRARVSPSLLFISGYSNTRAKDTNTGENLLRRPREKLSLGLYGRWKKAAFTLTAVYTGTREDMDYSSITGKRVTLDAFTLLNGTVSYQITTQIQLFIRMDNLLNTRYELVKGYGAPGFSFYAGFKID